MKPTDNDGSSQPRTSPATGQAPLDWPAATGIGRELAAEVRAEIRRRRRRRLVVAAVCGLLAVGVWWRSVPGDDTGKTLQPTTARIVAPDRQVLADGSVLELKAGSVCTVAFSPSARRVHLTSGEIHCMVAKDSARPFVVAVDGVEVRAVGTAFSVGCSGRAVDVLVTEGRVAVARAPADPSDTPRRDSALPSGIVAMETGGAILGAGDRTSIALDSAAPAAPVVVPLSADEINRRLAWRVPRFEFTGTPLAKVVQMFNERGYLHLTLGDPALENVCVSGVLRADNAEALLQLLAADHGVESDRSANTIVLWRQR
jgi:transmembrane sensor